MDSSDSAAAVPYQAYKPKRHSRNVSNPSSPSLEIPEPVAVLVPAPPETAVLDTPQPVRKMSTFRRMPLRNKGTTTPLPSSPLRSAESHLPPPSEPSSAVSTTTTPPVSAGSQLLSPPPRSSSLKPSLSTNPSTISTVSALSLPPPPQSQSQSQSPTRPPLPASGPESPATPQPQPRTRPQSPAAPQPQRTTPMPYRPGFQPKGVYRPLTDTFTSLRQAKRDVGRVERTKLERRLEKLTLLHFPPPPPTGAAVKPPEKKSMVGSGARPSLLGTTPRRASSFFDLDFRDIRDSAVSLDGGALWRSVSGGGPTGEMGKNEMRAAEQRITPWEEDSKVGKCPLCAASFHPLTNRKHHCRTCGRIICSLPPKRPQRPLPCSFLFVVDPITRAIEEVGEGVDYGVKKRRGPSGSVDLGKGGKTGEEDEADKFLKGVRVCRECRPVIARQQYQRELQHVPTFVKLYEAFLILEKEIGDSLPQFQELILSLNTESEPTKEAALARKRLLESFAQYDALAKRIRRLPTTAGPGSSQDRVQGAVGTRAAEFLRRNMVPLQSLSPPKRTSSSQIPTGPPISLSALTNPPIDPDSQLAHTLQPLLEQEALLESFVTEANAQRKFEDAKTLKLNLGEIRGEIERVLKEGDGGSGGGGAGVVAGAGVGKEKGGGAGGRGTARRNHT